MARSKDFDEKEVLEKALNLFWCNGYNSTSAQEIVDCLGISRSSLYDTFGDKRTLYIKTLKQYQEGMGSSLLATIKASTNPKVTIKNIFQTLVNEAIVDKKSRGCFMVNASIEVAPFDEEISKIVTENMQSIEEAFYVLIKEGQNSGVLSKANTPRAVARFLFNNIFGIRVAAKSGAEKKALEDIVKVCLSVL
jgi:TetR/AcrR family transcriptional repressor of nem operon